VADVTVGWPTVDPVNPSIVPSLAHAATTIGSVKKQTAPPGAHDAMALLPADHPWLSEIGTSTPSGTPWWRMLVGVAEIEHGVWSGWAMLASSIVQINVRGVAAGPLAIAACRDLTSIPEALA
jgi:hypothetical protein